MGRRPECAQSRKTCHNQWTTPSRQGLVTVSRFRSRRRDVFSTHLFDRRSGSGFQAGTVPRESERNQKGWHRCHNLAARSWLARSVCR